MIEVLFFYLLSSKIVEVALFMGENWIVTKNEVRVLYWLMFELGNRILICHQGMFRKSLFLHK